MSNDRIPEETIGRKNPEDRPSKPLRQLVWVTAILGMAGLMFFLVDPAASPHLFWPCPFHKLTGLYCPGCGGQRALHALLHGRFVDALSRNALAVLIAAPIAAYAYVAYACHAFGMGGIPRLNLSTRWLMLLGLLFTLFGVLRNLPFGPFPWLAP